jgi:HEAT repeat protein
MKATSMCNAFCGVVCVVAASIVAAQPQPADDATKLVQQLPTGCNSTPDSRKLEARIAELGVAALPALKKELRLGIRSRERNSLSGSNRSRRASVVSVLALMPDAESTDMLVKCLADPPDCYGMQFGVLLALSKRALSTAQIQALLGNQEPEIVLAGIEHAAARIAAPELKAAVEKVFETKAATEQFKNEYGASTANADALWNVRFAAGKALGVDLTAEMEERAVKILAKLAAEVAHPTRPEVPQWLSYGSESENIILREMQNLAALTPPAKRLVEQAAADAEGDYAKILDMARAQLGDRTRIAAVADALVTSENHTIRFCAAMTLRRIGDRSAIPALRQALRDPYRRTDGSDVGPPRQIYPVRGVAGAALIDMGADPKEIRAAMND